LAGAKPHITYARSGRYAGAARKFADSGIDSRGAGKYGKGFSMPLLGRFGDAVPFSDLPRDFQVADLAELLGATAVGGGDFDGQESCGSPGEVTNDPSRDHQYGMWRQPYLEAGDVGRACERDLTKARQALASYREDSMDTWLNVVAKSPDQLRHRVAWALAQSHVIGENGLGQANQETEVWVNYHDIFVRNAFGNFRSILQEVAYNPLMASYLTFLGSGSYAATGSFPDENFSREFMELYSIGLYTLNQDGTRVKDAQGEDVVTYDNENIM
jgi:hypothetical protein